MAANISEVGPKLKQAAPMVGRGLAASAIGLTGAFSHGEVGNAAVETVKAWINPGSNITREFKPFDTPVALAAPLESAPIPEGGWFYTETNGGAGPDKGYGVRGPMYQKYTEYGGADVWGPPVSRQYVDEVGRVSQAFQRGIFQINPQTGTVEWANVFDVLSEKGNDQWLLEAKQTPKPEKWNDPTDWGSVVNLRQSALDQFPAIRAVYDSSSNPVAMFGLPVTHATDMGNHYAIRCQRAVFQLWKEDVPWAKAGQVTVALGGDIAKQAGLIPASAIALEDRFGQGGPTPEASKLPELPPGGISSFPDPEGRRRTILNAIGSSRPVPPGARFFSAWGSVAGPARAEGDKLIITIDTQKPNSVFIYTISPDNPVIFSTWRGGNKNIFVTKVTDANTAKRAMDAYFKDGDPIHIDHGGQITPGFISSREINTFE